MWNALAANKLTQWRIDRQKYQTHRQNLGKIGAVLKISSPLPLNHNFTPNPLTDHLKNLMILKLKLGKIKPDPMLNHVTRRKRTLSPPINPQSNVLQSRNRVLWQRILNARSYYPFNQIKKGSKKLVKIAKNISQNARRTEKHYSKKQPRRCSSAFKANQLQWNGNFINRNGSAPRPNTARERDHPTGQQQLKLEARPASAIQSLR